MDPPAWTLIGIGTLVALIYSHLVVMMVGNLHGLLDDLEYAFEQRASEQRLSSIHTIHP